MQEMRESQGKHKGSIKERLDDHEIVIQYVLDELARSDRFGNFYAERGVTRAPHTYGPALFIAKKSDRTVAMYIHIIDDLIVCYREVPRYYSTNTISVADPNVINKMLDALFGYTNECLPHT